ncbi:hypothetical protein NGM10_11900 [Halorussus salilacus]|uniref:DUF7383 domain-containing protein n=1 Tax=Halorussus salilacus TaxID=2953750 RepID=UPI00209F77EE|nr:hypothetical protein [Halorussus salilacus]USZ67428.1 hypothetical protein NGM10_11900 [Halorussus salilacus]
MPHRANYALVNVSCHLGPTDDAIEVPWAEYVGDATPEFEFEVPTDDATDAYLGLQAFRVGTFDHELRINGESLGGFDVPPADGWQYWEDAVTEVELREGTNTLQVVRDESVDDSFAVNNVTVHWREPVE